MVVSGVRSDDHPDDPSQSCTAISDDNRDVPGRVDYPGDVDCFSFTPTDVNSDLFVRSTSQVGGMDSVVTVMGSDGSTVVSTADASTSVNPYVGVIAPVAASDLDMAGMVVTIAHGDSAMGQGYYAMSAGTMLVSDKSMSVGTALASEILLAVNPTGAGDASDEVSPRKSGGGAIDPWIWTVGLGVLIGLAGLFGWRRRRSRS